MRDLRGSAAGSLTEIRLVGTFSSTQAGRPLALVLGLNEIASALAVCLHQAGYSVIMAHDPRCVCIRRGMAFFDALFDGCANLGGVAAVSVESTLAARLQLSTHDGISVTRLDVSELLIVGSADVLVDARMAPDVVTPQLRKLARFTIGIGNGFAAGVDCDAVVAAPAASKAGEDAQLTVMRAPAAGRWHTSLDIGMRIYKDFQLGHVGATIVKAPIDGVLRGIARDGTNVPEGAELIEIATRGTGVRWWGLDVRGVRIGEEVLRALQSLGAERWAAPAGAKLRLVHSR